MNSPTRRRSSIARFLAAVGAFAAAVLASPAARGVGTWTRLDNDPPASIQLMLLMSDGSVLAARYSSNRWYRLTPDGQGSYVHGTWSVAATANNTRLFYSSQVLKDGRVFVAGGEYGTGGAKAEVFDPVMNTWTIVTVPTSVLDPSMPSTLVGNQKISDAMSEILPNGNVIIAPVESRTPGQTIIYNPTNNSIINGPTMRTQNPDEAGWVKLADNSILCIDPPGGSSERFIPATNTWIADASVPVPLYDNIGGEIGAGILLPNGRAIFFGSTNHTAIYTPSGSTAPGSWAAGPNIPNMYGCPDAPAAMMSNGKILLAVSDQLTTDATGATVFPSPTYFYEFDYTNNTFTPAPGPVGPFLTGSAYLGNMLCLPDGTILYSHSNSDVYVYTPDGTPLTTNRPAVTSITDNGNGSYHLTGTRLNGLTEGAGYGDDAQANTNYPIVRVTNGSGNVYYARSFNWSNTGVQTGTTPVTTEYVLPPLPVGPYQVSVSANGLASDPYTPRQFFACVPQWIDGAFPTVPNGPVYATAWWDPDGPGPLPARLVVGGEFTMAGSTPANNIAVWDGLNWSALGPAGGGFNGRVNALTVLANGTLVAGGNFTFSGTTATNYIAAYNSGSGAWGPIGTGVDNVVRSLAVLPTGMLIAGGSFINAGGVPAFYIARWDGFVWAPLSTRATNGPVYALAVQPNGHLLAGGNFTTIGGTIVNHIARWDGVTFFPIGTGFNGDVYSILVRPSNSAVVAGGNFTAAGTVACAGIATYNGFNWVAMGNGLGAGGLDRVNSIVEVSNALSLPVTFRVVAGGSFAAAGTVLASNIAIWDDAVAAWSPINAGANLPVNALNLFPSGDVLAAGNFTMSDGINQPYLAHWASVRPIPDLAQSPVVAPLTPSAGATASVSAIPTPGYYSVSYQWKRNGVNVSNGAHGASASGGTVSGASGVLSDTTNPTTATPVTLTISNVQASDAGQYTLVLSNTCPNDSTTSRAATLAINACAADFNGAGGLTVQDIFDFLNAWFAGSIAADFNHSGALTVQDIFDFLNAWFAGC